MRGGCWGRLFPLIGSLALGPLLAAGCGADTPEARSAEHPLPPYVGHATELFDDSIEPMAVGLPMDPSAPPQGDPRVRERTQVGDAVVRARIRTVTSKAEDRGTSWQLGLHVVERLAGTGPLEADFTLAVSPTDSAAGIVRAYEARLIGKTFVVYVRLFAHAGAPPGDPGDLRFHVAGDDADQLSAVKAAVLLDKVH